MPAAAVSLVTGGDRRANIAKALELASLSGVLADKQHVLIKPNFVLTDNPNVATHVDGVRAVLDFVRSQYTGRVTIAEGPAFRPAEEGFQRYGYKALVREYDVELLDLNACDSVPVAVYDWRLKPLRLHLARSVVDSDFRISVALPKTHDEVIVTLGLKNMIMGSLINGQAPGSARLDGGRSGGLQKLERFFWRRVPRSVRHAAPVEWLRHRAMSLYSPSDKFRMHQSCPVINLNLALLAPLVFPHLSVIDGFEAMEGNGPTLGTLVALRAAVVSADALAADTVCAALMGFDPSEVGYLHYCKKMGLGVGDLGQIEINGNTTLAQCSRKLRPHDSYQRQRRWSMEKAESLLP